MAAAHWRCVGQTCQVLRRLYGARARQQHRRRAGHPMSPKYRLDTNICLYLMKQQPVQVKARFEP